jgi:hypothetical protein
MCDYKNKSEDREHGTGKILNNHKTEDVESLKYVGSKIMTNENVKEETAEKINNSRKFYHLVRDIFWKWRMPKKGKIYVIKS